MKDDVGSFIYQIVEKGNSLQVLADIKINQAVIPPHHYDSLKEMFKKVVEKEAERVVLSKITPDGNSEGSKGGR